MTSRAVPGRRRECAEAPGREGGSGDGIGQRGDDGQHRLDALADQQRAAGRLAEADGETVDAAERLARARQVGFRRARGIEPGAVHTGDGAVTGAFPRIGAFPRTRVFPWTEAILRVGGDGGDQRGKAAHAGVVAVDQCGMEAERREAAAVDSSAARRYASAWVPSMARQRCQRRRAASVRS